MKINTLLNNRPDLSPDLNLVDYKIWGAVQEIVYKTCVADIDCLKKSLLHEWEIFYQRIIDKAVAEWRLRLAACVNARGCHFKFKL